ncbi:carbohydrate ABC transporter substrate-binding protein (CUT1 family) [Ruminiclostridium sufflavum DSM 19573]|uniref:Carbohydrate ABC transporter substrate-binding protein (CUT1 family) n=1 Tax=Ruminiclostridium sufflavum DSM 19573 TaxID=1121337 RepID=A0A318XNV3_9FIRM|nr:extracellular solute-binding protein [Ruminiclostridium sufflavum]PYG87758.1 carbohydrate ABC transporter substrate-binding protein (CUT1 family) [Ruminiclostridium sufflavum DSM 19573]
MQKALKALALFLLVVFCTGCFFNTQDLGVQKSKKKQITIYTIQGDSAVNKVIADSVMRFQQDNIDFEVVQEIIPNDLYKNRLSVCVATNQMPDVFPTWSGATLNEYISIGEIVNLEKYMKQDDYSERFNEKALGMVTDKDGIWAVPVENMAIALIFYNKDIFAELDMLPPETYEQLLEDIRILRKNGYIPFALANRTAWTGSMFYMYFVDRMGGPSVFDNAANRKNGGSFRDEVFVRAGEMIQQLVDMGAFPEGFNWTDEDAGEARDLMYNGSAGMMLAGSWFLSTLRYEQPGFVNKVGVFPFPSVKEGKGDSKNTIGTLGDNYYAVSSTCKYKDEAFQLIKYLIDDTAVNKRIAAGKIPPVKNPKITDPLTNKILDYINESPNVQFWYDQYLPLKLSDAHLSLTRQIFGGKDPKAAADSMEKIAEQYYTK